MRKINILKNDDYWYDFSKTLNELGYNSEVIDISLSNIESYVVAHPQDLNIVWGGFFRKKTSNNPSYVGTPSVGWAEQGVGLSHYDTISLDPKGHVGNGTLPASKIEPITESQDKELQDWLERHYFNKITNCGLPELPDDFILFPLQHLKDSTMMFDCPSWARDYQSIINHICSIIPENTSLVVKQHPKHRNGFSSETRGKVVYLPMFPDSVNPSLNDALLRKCRAVVAVNSSYVVEALLYNKPILTAGKGIFTGNGLTTEVNRLQDIQFDNLFVEEKANRSFLYEICLNRQILKSECANKSVVSRVWNRYMELSKALYGE